ncbi:MAG TPA: DUF503 family protein [bacterium]|nr:DUF503 family protein [bacterium]HPJ72030.1 DUF503 family protein [bacterium]HPQ66657.1 DUF503 family protein [bacterium]
MIRVALLEIEIMLPGCRTLKEKRHRLRGLKDRLGSAGGCVVVESGRQDNLQRAQWSVVAAAVDAASVDRLLRSAEDRIEREIDGVVVSSSRQWL